MTLDILRLALALSEFEDGDTRSPSPRLLARLIADANRLDKAYRNVTSERLAAAQIRMTPTPEPGGRRVVSERDDVLAALVDVLAFVTEEGHTAAQSWAPDILRLMEDRGFRFVALQSQEARE